MAFSVASVVGIVTAGVAATTIWLLLAQPLSVANAVNTGDVSALVRALGVAIGHALQAIFQYL